MILFDVKFNRMNSEVNTKISPEEKILLLNNAQLTYFKKRVRIAETNSEVSLELSPFEVNEHKCKLVKHYENYSIFELPPDCFKVLRRRVIAKKEKCKTTKSIRVVNFQKDDLNYALSSPFWKPDFGWEICIGNLGSKGYYVWHGGDYKIDSLIVDWYRRPKNFHAPSMHPNEKYLDWITGEMITKDVNCEMIEEYAEEIVDIAVVSALTINGDNLSTKVNEIILKDKI